MRILILSQYYAPEPVPKPHELACSLRERGHEVSAITGFPNFPYGSLYEGYSMRPWKREEREGIRILRVPLFPDHSRSVVRRALNYGSFAMVSSILGPLLAKGADAMYVYHPPLTMGIPAWTIGLLRRIPFIYEVQDVWPEAVAATGMVRNRSLLGGMGILERFVYRRAAAVTTISEVFKRKLVSKGVPPDKVRVIPNWADDTIFRPVAPDPGLAEDTGMAGRFNVLYAGNIGPAQGLETAIEAAERVSHIPEIQFVLMGYGEDKSRLESLASSKSLTNVRFLGWQEPETLPHYYALADALLVHLNRDPAFEGTIPSKTLTYMACGRPIIMASSGDAAALVREAGAGVTCEPQNPDMLAQAVLRLHATSVEERERMGQAGREAFLKRYTRRVLVDKYEELMTQISRPRDRTKG